VLKGQEGMGGRLKGLQDEGLEGGGRGVIGGWRGGGRGAEADKARWRRMVSNFSQEPKASSTPNR
jgi:hypothetical protein